jgi:hypothetical protein
VQTVRQTDMPSFKGALFVTTVCSENAINAFKGRSQQSLWPCAVQGTQSAVTVALRRSRDAVSSPCGPTPLKGRSRQSLWPCAVQGTQSAVTVPLHRSVTSVTSRLQHNNSLVPVKGSD